MTLSPEESLKEIKNRFMVEIDSGNYDVDPNDIEELTDKDYNRFLISRNFNIDLSLGVLLDSLVWRKVKNVRYITFDDVREELVKDKICVYGYDLEKRLTAGVTIRNHFPSTCNKEKLEKLLLFFAEKAKHLLHPDNQTCNLIFDLTDFTLANMDIDIIQFMIKVFTEFYPETLGVMLVVNSPWIFKGCWKIVKPLLDPITAKKIAFVSQEKLVNYIHPDILPPNLGGNNEIMNYGLGVDERINNFTDVKEEESDKTN